LNQHKFGKAAQSEEEVKREIAIMKKLNHENVMTLHDVIDDPNSNKLCAGSRC
jgi:[calcium/calmodulin-dependent protein kinase] kinase